jgi:hypothetical protein
MQPRASISCNLRFLKQLVGIIRHEPFIYVILETKKKKQHLYSTGTYQHISRKLAIRLNYWQHLTQPLSLYQHISCQISHQQHYYIVNFQEKLATSHILHLNLMQPLGRERNLAIRLNYWQHFIHQILNLTKSHLMLLGQVFILILAKRRHICYIKPLGLYQVDILHEKVKTEDNLAYVTL